MSQLGRIITQIAVSQSETQDDVFRTIVACCSDNTLWFLNLDDTGVRGAHWRQLPCIPLDGGDQ